MRSSVLILDDKLAGPNYLYVEGVINLARALMRQDRGRIKEYYEFLSGVALDDQVLDSLKKDADNTIAFALKAILKFKPIEINDPKELEWYKKVVEAYLVAA